MDSAVKITTYKPAPGGKTGPKEIHHDLYNVGFLAPRVSVFRFFQL